MLGGCDLESLEICTSRPWGRENEGCDPANLEMHLEAMIKWDWRSTCRWSIWRRSFGREARQQGGETGAGTQFIGQLRIVGMLRIDYIKHCREMKGWLGAGDSRSWNDVVRSVWITQCILYWVYAVVSVCCASCMLYSVYAVLGDFRSVCLYSIYAVLVVNSGSLQAVIERDDFTSCS